VVVHRFDGKGDVKLLGRREGLSQGRVHHCQRRQPLQAAPARSRSCNRLSGRSHCAGQAPRASAGSKQDNNKREGRDQRAEQQQTNRFLNVHVKDDEFHS
jgi:hypothetical protein